MRSSIARLAIILLSLPAVSCEEQHASGLDDHAARRERMVAEQIAARGISDPRVLAAMREVPRHLFVPPAAQPSAYDDRPLPIGHDQTISQPYIVALMTELARPQPTDAALEIGTGSGYQAAVLSKLVRRVYTIEIVDRLGRDAKERISRLGYTNVSMRVGDGYAGWSDAAPFDCILVTAAPDHVPPALIEQLKPGGRLIIPVGPIFDVQELLLLEKDGSGQMHTRHVAPVRFVPLRRQQ